MTGGVRVRRAADGCEAWVPESATLGAGGEGRVLAVDAWPGLVAKLYHQPDAARESKLRAMVARPPADPGAATGHAALCWPADLLLDAGTRTFLGFLMPRLSGVDPVFHLYNPGLRRRERPDVSWADLHDVARQVAAVMGAVHGIGAVVGDINESNTVVDAALRVTLVDCDSFRVVDAVTGQVYRSPVAKPEFTAPELQGQSMAEVDQTVEDDLFGLAVLVYQLLMEGTHPFEGVLGGTGDPVPYGERIARGWVPWAGRGGPYRPKPLAVSLEVLHPALRSAFVRCFVEGHARPEVRPDAGTWERLLAVAAADLAPCPANPRHQVPSHLGACPWCERRRLLGGLDPFPSPEDVAAGRHLPTPVPRAPRPALAVAHAGTRPRAPVASSAPPSPRRASSPSRRRGGLVLVGIAAALVVVGLALTPTRHQKQRNGETSAAPTAPAAARRPPAGRASTAASVETAVRALSELGVGGGASETARQLVASGRRGPRGRTPLMIAAETGKPGGVQLMLDAGADVDERDPEGFTALMRAANTGTAPVVQLLLEAGADVGAADKEGYSALMFGVMSKRPDVVRALLRGGADPNQRTHKGWSPLISAADKGLAGVIAALVAAGARVDDEDQNGCTALMAAAAACEVTALRELLAAGASPSRETPCGSARGYAAAKGCFVCVDALDDVARGAEGR